VIPAAARARAQYGAVGYAISDLARPRRGRRARKVVLGYVDPALVACLTRRCDHRLARTGRVEWRADDGLFPGHWHRARVNAGECLPCDRAAGREVPDWFARNTDWFVA